MEPSATISLILRILSGPAADGRLVGQVEVVETGEVIPVHTGEELAELARRLAVPPVIDAALSPSGPVI